MAEPHALLEALPEREARQLLTRCCAASRWVEGMLARRPYGSLAQLLASAAELFATLERADLLEAFAHHPRIGADLAALRERFAATAALSSREQAGVRGASEATLHALHDENEAYEARFGFPFIVLATGKSADEMLALLRARLENEPAHELDVAAGELAKITTLRLEKLA